MFMVLFGFLLIPLGNVRLLFFSLISVGQSVGHSTLLLESSYFPEVVGGYKHVTVDFHFLLVDFTADRECTVLHNKIFQWRLYSQALLMYIEGPICHTRGWNVTVNSEINQARLSSTSAFPALWKLCTVKSSLLVLLNELAAVKEMLNEMLKVTNSMKSVYFTQRHTDSETSQFFESNTTKSVFPRLYYSKCSTAGCTSTWKCSHKIVRQMSDKWQKMPVLTEFH